MAADAMRAAITLELPAVHARELDRPSVVEPGTGNIAPGAPNRSPEPAHVGFVRMRCTCFARGDELVQRAGRTVPVAEEEVGEDEVRPREPRGLAIAEALRELHRVLVELPGPTDVADREGLARRGC